MTRTLAFMLCVFTIGLLTGVVFVYGQAPDWDPSVALVPGVRCPNARQDLRDVWLTDELRLEFELVNDSADETFSVGPIRGSCGCTVVEPTIVELGPGEKVVVKAIVDLERADLPRDGAANFTEALTAPVEAPDGEVYYLSLRASGIVRPAYSVKPKRLAFGPVTNEDPVSAQLTIRPLFARDATGIEILSVPAGLEAEVVPWGPDPQEFVVRVTAGRGGEPGWIEEAVRYRAVTPQGASPSASLPIRARVVPDIQVLPGSVLFGAVPLGALRSSDVTIRSRGGHLFRVMSATSDSPAVTVEARGLTNLREALYTISTRNGVAGSTKSSVFFSFVSPSGVVTEATLSVWAYFSRLAPD